MNRKKILGASVKCYNCDSEVKNQLLLVGHGILVVCLSTLQREDIGDKWSCACIGYRKIFVQKSFTRPQCI
jgi:hypothetical protein